LGGANFFKLSVASLSIGRNGKFFENFARNLPASHPLESRRIGGEPPLKPLVAQQVYKSSFFGIRQARGARQPIGRVEVKRPRLGLFFRGFLHN
jgi:hypothetical protein